MAFPIIPRKRSGSVGYPTSLQLGELAVNTSDGSLYLGGDQAVMLLNGPAAAGTVVSEHTANGTATAFLFAGYNGTADGGYIVSVGGIDQPPSKYEITSTGGGTLTFVEAPLAGELVSIRAIVAGSGGGGSGNATQIQGRNVASTAPTNGQVLAWDAATSAWKPQTLNGSVTFNTPGTHTWAVPAWLRVVELKAKAGNGSDGTATNGAQGQAGEPAGPGVPPTTGANGANGTATAGVQGKSVTMILPAYTFVKNGGAAGLAGIPGYGGGGSGGGGGFGYNGANGASGSFVSGGGGGGGGGTGASYNSDGSGGGAGGEGATSGEGSSAGVGASNGGNGGSGGTGLDFVGGGGGGGVNGAGGGGGGGAYYGGSNAGQSGQPGYGGTADTSMCAGGEGESYDYYAYMTSAAGQEITIIISEGAGDAFLTINY